MREDSRRMAPSALLSSFSPWYHKLTPVPEDSHVDFSDEEQPVVVRQPFKGLIICATGVPKDVRKQMREVTERLGGVYSPDLHRGCTHLVVQGTSGQKFRHAIKHGEKWGLRVVTMRWFLVSLQLNTRMDENPYKVIVTDFSLEDGEVTKAPPTDDCTEKVLQPRPENCSTTADASIEKGSRAITPHVQEPLEDSSTHSDLNLALALVPRPASLELVTINGESAIAEVKVEEVKLSEDLFKGYCFYIDPEVSAKLLEQLQASIDTAGGTVCAQWFIGCKATHLVCEGSTLRKYVGRAANVVTPLWVLRSVERGSLLKSVQFSVDMGRHLASLLGDQDDGPGRPAARSAQQGESQPVPSTSYPRQPGPATPSPSPGAVVAAMAAERCRKREQEVQEMKAEIRQRRSKRPGTQSAAPTALSPLQLLESVCWRITDSPVTARVYCDSDRESSPGPNLNYELQPNSGWHSPDEQTVAQWAEGEPPVEWNDQGVAEASLNGGCGRTLAGNETSLRGMKESERSEVVFRGSFLTLLFPVDRFGELGPRSRGFFSEKGFTRQQLLERVHTFYQEGMTDEEVSLGMHTDSKHADKLRALYASQPMDSRQLARPLMLRGEFLGSRQNFEGLQRTNHGASGQTYEVVLTA